MFNIIANSLIIKNFMPFIHRHRERESGGHASLPPNTTLKFLDLSHALTSRLSIVCRTKNAYLYGLSDSYTMSIESSL